MPSSKVYSADLEVYATIFVIANSENEARQKIRAKIEAGNLDTQTDVSDLGFNHENLPEVSFSPAMTITSKQEFGVEYVEER